MNPWSSWRCRPYVRILLDKVEIGTISRPHGVRGELRVRLHNADSTAFSTAAGVMVRDRFYAIASARFVDGGALLRLDAICDRDQAFALVGAPVYVSRDQLALAPEDVLLDELVGCTVSLEDGREWGVLVEVICGVQDLIVVHQGAIERYLPLVDEFVIAIDVVAMHVVVAPPTDLPEWER